MRDPPVKCCAHALVAAICFFLAPPLTAAELKAWTGGPAPALALKDTEGVAHRLAAYGGKVVIVNFWATWCEPCRDEMPSLNRLKRSLDGKPVAFLAVNLGEGEGRIAEFLKGVPVEFPVLLDRDGEASKAWNVRLLPATFILSRGGRIRYSSAGERDWADAAVRAKIDALLQERPGR